MSTPEIHIRVPSDPKGKALSKRRRTADSAGADEKPAKRRRGDGRSSMQEPTAPPGESKSLSKRALLSNNTESFRHLFSFGSKAPSPEVAAHAAAEPPESLSAAAAKPAKDRTVAAAAPVVRFSIRPEPDDVRALPTKLAATYQADHTEDTSFVERTEGRSTFGREKGYVVHDGLAQDTPSDVRAMALKYFGGDKTVTELQTEWLDGGKRDDMREDLRLKRYRRKRGRVLGGGSGTRDLVR
jgi:hypothetical protein